VQNRGECISSCTTWPIRLWLLWGIAFWKENLCKTWIVFILKTCIIMLYNQNKHVWSRVKKHCKFINAEIAKKKPRAKRARKFLFDLVCHVWCVSWWKLDLFKVKIDVCVRYNRISAYCVPTPCVLRTV